ncbi:MAG TPA: hypothetical protein DCP28_35060 [Cytophagales bacterium]|nr:hypothetical protein [Cytophagales bacterium]
MEALFILFTVFMLYLFFKDRSQLNLGKGRLIFLPIQFAWLVLKGGYQLVSWLIHGLVAKSSGIYGTSAFMTAKEQKKFFDPNNRGLVLDGYAARLSETQSFNHTLITSPSGGGKSSTIIIPNLHLLEGSIIATDIGGSLYQNSAGKLQERGYDIQIFNLRDPEQSFTYNPLATCRSDHDLEQVIDMLVNTAFEGDQKSDVFWTEGAKDCLMIVAKLLMRMPFEYQTLGELRSLLLRFGERGQELTPLFAEYAENSLLEEFAALVTQSDRVLQSILSTAKVALKKWSDPAIRYLTSDDAPLDFTRLRTRKSVLFITVPPERLEYYGVLISLLYSSLFAYGMATENKQEPLHFLLDEVANIPPITSLPTIIAVARQKRMSLTLAIQSLSQLKEIYGQSSETIIANCSTKWFTGGLPLDTAQLVSQMLGNTTKWYTSPDNYDWLGRPKSRTEMSMPLMRPEEVMQLERGKVIVFHSTEKPMLLKTTPYFKHPTLKSWSTIPPPTVDSLFPDLPQSE